MTDTVSHDARTTRASWDPSHTSGRLIPWEVRSVPSIVIRAPSTAHKGWIAVMRGRLTVDGMGGSRVQPRGQGTDLRVVEFDVPVQEVAPALWCVAETESQPHNRRPCRAARGPDDPHPSLRRGSPAFPSIAADA